MSFHICRKLQEALTRCFCAMLTKLSIHVCIFWACFACSKNCKLLRIPSPKERHHTKIQYQLKSENISLAQVFSKMEQVVEVLSIEDYSVSQTTLDNVSISQRNDTVIKKEWSNESELSSSFFDWQLVKIHYMDAKELNVYNINPKAAYTVTRKSNILLSFLRSLLTLQKSKVIT